MPARAQPRTATAEADWLVGGHPALDFVNSCGGSGKARDGERLTGYASLLDWCRITRTLSEEEAEGLAKQAATQPQAAEAALAALRVFREALHACLLAAEARQPWPEADRERVETGIKAALVTATLAPAEEAAGAPTPSVWRSGPAADPLALPLTRLALAAEALLRSSEMTRLKACERCSWLFLDHGRGRPRRWCSMTTCGSRAKSARYYRRRKAAGVEGAR